jgi:hypothetical protein
MKAILPLLLLATATTQLIPREANATPQATCEPVMFPGVRSVQLGAVPANLPAFGYANHEATTADVHLTLLDPTGRRLEVPLDVGPDVDAQLLKVAPRSPATLLAGERYELTFALSSTTENNSLCDHDSSQTPMTFDVVDAAKLPTKLGELREAPKVTFGSNGAYIQVAYVLADEMKPWAHLMRYRAKTEKFSSYHDDTVSLADGVLTATLGIACNYFETGTHHTLSLTGRLPFAPSVTSPTTPLEFECIQVDYSSPSEEASGGGSARGPGDGDRSTYLEAPRDEQSTASCSAAAAARPSARSSVVVPWMIILGLLAVGRRLTSSTTIAQRPRGA